MSALLRGSRTVPRTRFTASSVWRPTPGSLTALIGGLWLFGTGDALILASALGASPWSVLAQGLSVRTGLGIGWTTFGVSVAVLALWIPLRQRPGLGTVMNIIVIALALGITYPRVSTPDSAIGQLGLVFLGIGLIGLGSGLYLTSGHGPGPRDGWMTGLHQVTGWPVGRVRLLIEVSVLVAGWALGGIVGIGTALFALLVGQSVALGLAFVHRLSPGAPEQVLEVPLPLPDPIQAASSEEPTQMASPTVAEYTLQRLAALGIDTVFGVPGDYAFSVDDAVENVSGLAWVGCANELNAAYAADGYARIRGAAILSTTYGVGELSALNGVMGSKAHRLPVFHIVGEPSERIQHLGLITHHNLGDTRYDRFQAISGTACCVSAVLTPDTCIDELERVIREALRRSMPAYLVISEVNGLMPVIGTPVAGVPLEQIKRQRSDPTELAAAVTAITARVAAAQHPIATITTLTARYGVAGKAAELVSKANLPVAITANDKGVLDESLPQYIGLYAAQSSSPPEVRDIVEHADLILDIGGVMLTELNTGFWGAVLDTSGAICIHDNWIRSGTDVYLNVAIEDVLDALLETLTPRTQDMAPTAAMLELAGSGADPTSSASFYPRLQRRLRAGDTLVIETGTCMMHLNGMRLPAGVSAEEQGLWGSIGWATPATLGVAMAKTSGRTWLVTGDGSHQLTLNELAVMGRYGITPVIFVLNNGLYGIEDIISERGHEYDDLAPVQYHLLPAAFGCRDWLSVKVTTVAELDDAFDAIAAHDGAAYIEVMIPNEESQPLPEDVIDRGYKLRTPGS